KRPAGARPRCQWLTACGPTRADRPSLMCINIGCASAGYSQQMGRGRRALADLGEMTMLRNILAHIPSERPARPVIDVAVALALGRQAHLDAVAIGYESLGSVGMAAEGG